MAFISVAAFYPSSLPLSFLSDRLPPSLWFYFLLYVSVLGCTVCVGARGLLRAEGIRTPGMRCRWLSAPTGCWEAGPVEDEECPLTVAPASFLTLLSHSIFTILHMVDYKNNFFSHHVLYSSSAFKLFFIFLRVSSYNLCLDMFEYFLFERGSSAYLF